MEGLGEEAFHCFWNHNRALGTLLVAFHNHYSISHLARLTKVMVVEVPQTLEDSCFFIMLYRGLCSLLLCMFSLCCFFVGKSTLKALYLGKAFMLWLNILAIRKYNKQSLAQPSFPAFAYGALGKPSHGRYSSCSKKWLPYLEAQISHHIHMLSRICFCKFGCQLATSASLWAAHLLGLVSFSSVQIGWGSRTQGSKSREQCFFLSLRNHSGSILAISMADSLPLSHLHSRRRGLNAAVIRMCTCGEFSWPWKDKAASLKGNPRTFWHDPETPTKLA